MHTKFYIHFLDAPVMKYTKFGRHPLDYCLLFCWILKELGTLGKDIHYIDQVSWILHKEGGKSFFIPWDQLFVWNVQRNYPLIVSSRIEKNLNILRLLMGADVYSGILFYFDFELTLIWANTINNLFLNFEIGKKKKKLKIIHEINMNMLVSIFGLIFF